jgi:hypothetical protein
MCVAAITLLGVSVTEAQGGDPSSLTSTLLGRLEPGGNPQLAVRWKEARTVALDVWIDFNGNGLSEAGEVVVESRLVAQGIAVIPLEFSENLYKFSHPRLWLRLRERNQGQGDWQADDSSRDVVDGCAWQPGFWIADVDGTVNAMIVLGEGSGSSLYVGGRFAVASGVRVNNIARWDGSGWSSLGDTPGALELVGTVSALAVFDDGSGPELYVAAPFAVSGGTEVRYLAKWNGSGWSDIGGPTGTAVVERVRALAVFDDGTGSALYVGGYFPEIDGLTVNHIARWDGADWSGLTGAAGVGMGGANEAVYALAVVDDGSGPGLYAGGVFDSAGGVSAKRLARWDGREWSAVGDTSSSSQYSIVFSLAPYDDGSGPALYVGGCFSGFGGIEANGIARWNGSVWSGLSGPSGTGVWGLDYSCVRSLATLSDANSTTLYVGGDFTSAGGLTVDHVAKWDGLTWSALTGSGGSGTNNSVRTLAVFDDGRGSALYVAGSSTMAGGVAANGIARWDGTEWSALSEASGLGLNGQVFAFESFDDGSGPELFVGGAFTTAGGQRVNGIARWDGTVWRGLSGPLGTGIAGYSLWLGVFPAVRALEVFDDGSGPALFVGGSFASAGGVEASCVAKWDGSGWSSLTGPDGNGTDGPVLAMASVDTGTGPALYLGGQFLFAGGNRVNSIARWDGVMFSGLGSSSHPGYNGGVLSLAAFDDGSGAALYAGGSFTSADELPVARIGKWNGSTWTSLLGPSGIGLNGSVFALTVSGDEWEPGLYAGGTFTAADGEVVNRVARWDGSSWSPLPGALVPEPYQVYDLVVHDDGSGPALYVGGIQLFNGQEVHEPLWKWDGTDWWVVGPHSGSGTLGSIHALAEFDHGSGPVLYAGGELTIAGGVPSSRIAKWCCDASVPFDPVSVWSASHTVGEYSPSSAIELGWGGALDVGCSGVAGYSIVFDHEPVTVPDAVIDVLHTGDPHHIVSGPLADGSDHWAHVRACDTNGNCSAGRHLGPFAIDTTPPMGPFDLVSTSHTPGVASEIRRIDITWTPAVDAGSGLVGSAWAVTGAASWTCDQMATFEGDITSLTTPELADGRWYVHLCSVDALGHWGDVVTAGPYVIRPLFSDGFESGSTSAWSTTVE